MKSLLRKEKDLWLLQLKEQENPTENFHFQDKDLDNFGTNIKYKK